MKLLEERIIADGKVIGDDILKVDMFLNHQIDVHLLQEIGKEFKRRFDGWDRVHNCAIFLCACCFCQKRRT